MPRMPHDSGACKPSNEETHHGMRHEGHGRTGQLGVDKTVVEPIEFDEVEEAIMDHHAPRRP